MNYSIAPIEKVKRCPFSNISIGKKVKPRSSKKENENIEKSGYTVNPKDLKKRNYWSLISKWVTYLFNIVATIVALSSVYSFYINGMSNVVGLVWLSVCIFLAGKLFSIGIDYSIEVFDTLNFPEEPGKSVWKDGTYQNVDRYPIQPIGITWEHAVKTWFVRANFLIQFLKFLKYRVAFLFKAKDPTELDIIHYAINSTVLTLMQGHVENGNIVLTLHDSDFKSSFYQDGKLSTLDVQIIIPDKLKDDSEELKGASITRFQYDGVDITKRSEQLLILSTVCSFTMHPLLHSFFNNLYMDYQKLNETQKKTWEDLFLHGQFLNGVAHTRTADTVGISQSTFKSILQYNVDRSLNNHASTVIMVKNHSLFARFLLEIRRQVYRLVKKYQVPVNPETFFLTSIMHSMDHFTTGNALLWRNLDTEVLPNQRYPHANNFMWYLPSENVFTNRLSTKAHKHPFYQELYELANELDSEYASHLTLSVSF